MPDCDLYHGTIKYQHSVSITVIQSSLALSLLCTSYFLVPSIRPTPGDTPAHEPQEFVCFFIRDIQQFEIVFSLQSQPRTVNYLHYRLFKMSLLLFKLVYIHHSPRARKEERDDMHAVSLLPLSVSVSWSNNLMSITRQTYSQYN